MEYLDHLNPPQREGVLNVEGPSMIIAGAGSGKTRVLTYRIAHLIREKNVDPFSILALTFTNKAAREMRERIENVVGPDARSLWMGTFHSVFARILRAEAHHIGYPSNFTIYDTDDSKQLIRQLIKQFNLDDKTYKVNSVLGRISGAKNRLISWQRYKQDAAIRAEDEAAMKPKMAQIYEEYVKRCVKSSAMDFDDLLFNTNILFKNFPDVLLKYQHRFKFVMVDEFQDTNLSQYLITKKLAAVHQNICVVGDDAQSIYAFRGADIRNILNFEKDYPELKIIKLEQNYRSTKNIVQSANAIIAKNKAQLKKSVWTSNEAGDQIEVIKAQSDNEEGRLVAQSIFEEKMNNQLENSDFAILYRTNSQSRSMEEALRKMNIPYKIIGGLSFYQRKEIKDLIAYMRYTVNHDDEQSLRRIINYPKRGIGNTTVEKIIVAAYENNLSLWEVIQNPHRFFSGRAANAIDGFTTLIKSFKKEVEQKDAFDAATAIAKGSGILRELYSDKTVEGLSRYENVQELLNAIKDFAESEDVEDRSMDAFLQDVALLTSADDSSAEDKDKVTLMTIHSAKGLEFPYVYIVGMEEDLFPSQMMLNSRADLEEERRLFYVAITRAEKKLYLSFATSRYRFGNLKMCEASRFIDELDPQYIKMSTRYGSRQPESMPGQRPSFAGGGSNAGGYAKNLVSSINKDRTKSQQRQPAKEHTPSAGFEASDITNLKAGDKVEHLKFGFGEVLEIDDRGPGKKAKVKFEHFGEKTLLLSFAKLRIIE
ncbi:ATP-dependent helicase [Mangrovivirga cuniculi]|uniref:DNA 3'-5' helicase n=1 Tax=Mangrovivirga cuniculi TaxID=2715131 RepID=A0A4D7JNE0_9BACT|nr:UvrD-helicase domain-containing protein [Mangrovivirga cuniculi]QCK17111.1 ATP-dependent DNA helicase [Mangrovivirga cuniculi]